MPENLVHLASFVHISKVPGKRDIEDMIVSHLVDERQAEPLRQALDEFSSAIEGAEWRVLSARRADLLLRERLFDRVYAVRVRAFARNYRNAELDMHFSLQQDLTPLREFLSLLKEHGLHGLTARLERGLV